MAGEASRDRDLCCPRNEDLGEGTIYFSAVFFLGSSDGFTRDAPRPDAVQLNDGLALAIPRQFLKPVTFRSLNCASAWIVIT